MNESKKVLFIGNGPAALSKELSSQIDAFDGEVLRFNHYVTSGFEKYVGERTDIWFTCSNFDVAAHQHKKRYMATFASTDKDDEIADMIGAERINREYVDKTAQLMNHDHPSTGAVALQFFIDEGYMVYLYGFDFLDERKEHHYAKDGHIRGESHKHDPEWLFFHKYIETGKAQWFGLESGESIPIVRQPEPCGHDDNVRWYREPAHSAWYKWFGEMSKGKTVLDVGCGVGSGMDVLREAGVAEVLGVEVDDRLKSLGRNDIFTKLDLSTFSDNSFDVVTCVDVIEHVVKDLDLMAEMRRIARKRIYITTPCYVRSRCGNIAHCREYTIPQFMNIFKPYEIWSASPDGSIHRTLVLRRNNNIIEDWSPTSYDNHIKDVELIKYQDHVPVNTEFNQTVDNQEWAHICGIFRV